MLSVMVFCYELIVGGKEWQSIVDYLEKYLLMEDVNIVVSFSMNLL